MSVPVRCRWALVLTALVMVVSEMGSINTAGAETKRDSRGRVARPKRGKKLSPMAAAKRAQAEVRLALGSKGGHSADVVEMLGVYPFAGAHVQHWRLRNGLDVLLAPDSASLVVAYHTWVSVGTRDEQPGRGGIAHLLEHMMFKGTRLHPPGSFDRLLERHGASPNAATWLDFTMYHQAVPPEALAKVAKLEADRLTGLQLGKAGLKAELAVVANERREHVDNDPDGALEEVFYRLCYGKHPYALPVLGSARDIKSLKKADVQRFYRKHYHPADTTVVLVGAVEPVEVMVAVVDAYESATPTVLPPPAKRAPLPAPHVDGPLAATVVIDAHADRILSAWLGVAGNDPDHALLALAAEVLAGAPSTRLNRALVETGLAAGVSVDVPSLAVAGMFEVRVEVMLGVEVGRVRDALHDALRELIKATPISTAELAGARNRLSRQHYAELATIDGRAEALGHAVSVFKDPALPSRWWQAVQKATPTDVQKALAKMLTKRRHVELIGRASAAIEEASP